MDKTYQDRRRMSQFRNKPKHALYGVTQGSKSLVTSIGSGIEGLVVIIFPLSPLCHSFIANIFIMLFEKKNLAETN